MERSTVQSCLAAPVYWGFKALTIFPGCGARRVEVKQRHRRCRLCVEGRKIRLALLRVSDLKVGTIQRVRERYEIGSNARVGHAGDVERVSRHAAGIAESATRP